MPRQVYERIRGLRPGKSVFDLSYEKKFTADLGYIYPVMVDEVVPGDVFDIGMEAVVKTLPLAAPIVHPIYMTTHYFFCPYRRLAAEAVEDSVSTLDWESFITGGVNGSDAQTLDVWDVTDNAVKSLWDYLGFPIGVDAAGARPNCFPQWAYNSVWNWYFRDADLDAEVDLDSEVLLKSRWERDRFTAARLYQQRGTSPSVTGVLSGVLDIDGKATDISMKNETDATTRVLETMTSSGTVRVDPAPSATADARWVDPALEVDLSAGSVTTVDLTELRLSAAIQQFMELSQRAGYRYVDWLKAFYGVSPSDARLDRPEYIGGVKHWLVAQEVLQTSQSDTTPQGTMVGHGMIVASSHVGKYRVEEFGLIIGMMTIRPKTLYHQGIDKQWRHETRYDFYNPLFAGMSEQEVLTSEIYCSGVEAEHNTVFGYIPIFDHMRTKHSMVCGDMHADFDHWHLCRQFSANPTLGSTFVECSPRKDFLAAPSEETFMVSYGNRIRAIRPMPSFGTPGIGRL